MTRFIQTALTLIALLTFIVVSSAQDKTVVEVIAEDGQVLVGDFYMPEQADAPAILLFHMLGGNRSAYAPLIPSLVDAGYAVLNADLRGHGDSGSTQDWDQAEMDVQVWLDWMQAHEGIQGERIAIIGGSIGSNVALIGCANDLNCVTTIALSPGLDYRGVQPEDAVVNGLADRSVLLVASQGDRASAIAVRQMFSNATGNVAARIYSGSAHGTRLFDSESESVTHIILSWLEEHLHRS